ncbi:MAG: hypothetical protein FWE90_11480 [Defluviitaleaceae bacterium]|nr:hypothetical protein [Defluviitaleaceae bacterium]
MKNKIIEFLLENANPSIVLRIKKEILNDITPKEETDLLERIIPEKNVQTVIQSQKPDGWFGNAFHGSSPTQGVGMYNNMEVGLRYLAEKGFPPENRYIKRAVHSFLSDEPHYRECRMKAPEDDYTVTALGLFLPRSSVIIRAGYEYLLPPNDYINLAHDIEFSFKTFINVLQYPNMDDVIDTGKRKLCFKPGILWPCSYDLRILAHSQKWRNENNTALLIKAMNRLFSFNHVRNKNIYTKIKSFYKSPCLAFIHNQMFCLGLMDENYFNFDLMELFARCGVIKHVDFLSDKLGRFLSKIDSDLNIDHIINSKERDWGPYSGFALEEDWKIRKRKQSDILFRILLIIHYAE